METLKLEHLVPFLLHSLKIRAHNGDYTLSLHNTSNQIYISISHVLENKCKPILYPLSDLTKPIQHNGEEFVPIDLMFIGNKKTNGRTVPRFLEEKTREVSEGKISPVHLQYWIIQKLFEWKFNVFNLPDHLWIDVNTLDTNPYK